MDALADDGFVILGGPLGDGEEKFLLIIAAESEQAIEVLLADDPWTPLRLLRTASVERWEILLGVLASSEQPHGCKARCASRGRIVLVDID